MPSPHLEFRQVSKIYRLPDAEAKPTTMLGRLRHAVLPYRRDFYALRNVSFAVARHETLGLIGHNGAGKSTVLKLLSRITAPTRGTVARRGTIAGLIEVGSGFHPELSGRDNIFLSGSILGMRRSEIRAKLDSIISFAGVEAFVDAPVKQYSSGMAVRLGFSVAAHLESDILLLDEVLSVGDSTFQAKCVERIQLMKRNGRTMIFISHDLSAVEKLCDRLLLLKSGQVEAEGDVPTVLSRYQEQQKHIGDPARAKVGDTRARLRSFLMFDGAGAECQLFDPGDPMDVELTVSITEPMDDLCVEVFFFRVDGTVLCQLFSRAANQQISVAPGEHQIRFHCPALVLAPGIYHITVTLGDGRTGKQIDLQDNVSTVRVQARPGIEGMRGLAFMPQTLQVTAVRPASKER